MNKQRVHVSKKMNQDFGWTKARERGTTDPGLRPMVNLPESAENDQGDDQGDDGHGVTTPVNVDNVVLKEETPFSEESRGTEIVVLKSLFVYQNVRY